MPRNLVYGWEQGANYSKTTNYAELVAERDRLLERIDKYKQDWAENIPARQYKEERDRLRAALEEAVDYVRAYKCRVDAIEGIPGASKWLKKYEDLVGGKT